MEFQRFRVHYQDADAVQLIAGYLGRLMYPFQGRQPVILCIGSDRSTGDSLGPLVGTWLREIGVSLPIYGTLETPVHAGNLEEFTERLHWRHPGGVILAVDACLGRAESVGQIQLESGPLHPGKGVGKDLGTVGDVAILGVVNVGGFMEYFAISNARLGLVWPMARTIARGIAHWDAARSADAQAAMGEA